MTERKEHTCSVEGCDKPHYGKGWCNAHYRRWRRHGDPLGGSTSIWAAVSFLDEVVPSFDGDECLIWPFSRDACGYGKIKRGGISRFVNRIVCEREHGPPPTPKHQAAHSCGKGHLGCVNRRHLEWKSPKENSADKIKHGTTARGYRNSQVKLTESQVLKIRASTKTHRELAEEFGISQTQVSDIKARKKWAWLDHAA